MSLVYATVEAIITELITARTVTLWIVAVVAAYGVIKAVSDVLETFVKLGANAGICVRVVGRFFRAVGSLILKLPRLLGLGLTDPDPDPEPPLRLNRPSHLPMISFGNEHIHWNGPASACLLTN